MKVDPLEKVRTDKLIEKAHKHLLDGSIDNARSNFQEVLTQNPNHAAALHGMGVLCIQQSLFSEGEAWLRQATEVEPERAGNWNDLGESLRLLGKSDEAILAYRRSIELHPSFGDAFNNLAVVMAGLGDTEEAKRLLKQAIEINPEDPHPYNNLGVIMEYEGAFEDAVQNYEEAVKRKHDFIEAKQNYAGILARNPSKLMDSMRRLLENTKSIC